MPRRKSLDLTSVVAELRYELRYVDEAIRSLERLASGNRRGRKTTLEDLSAGKDTGGLRNAQSKSAQSNTMSAGSPSD
jgi:hypothetical protein